jgi:hypothetical protein
MLNSLGMVTCTSNFCAPCLDVFVNPDHRFFLVNGGLRDDPHRKSKKRGTAGIVDQGG